MPGAKWRGACQFHLLFLSCLVFSTHFYHSPSDPSALGMISTTSYLTLTPLLVHSAHHQCKMPVSKDGPLINHISRYPHLMRSPPAGNLSWPCITNRKWWARHRVTSGTGSSEAFWLLLWSPEILLWGKPGFMVRSLITWTRSPCCEKPKLATEREGRRREEKEKESDIPAQKSDEWMKEPSWIFQTHKMPCAEELKPQIDGSSRTMSTIPCHSNHPSWSPRHCRAETYYPYMTCMNSAHRIVSIIKCLLFCHYILEWPVM